MDIPAGKTTALVGSSGSGKSTIIGLLERWYDQTAGTILLDGIDIRQLNVTWLRTQVRLVQQEPVLFSGTIFDNVAFGLEETPYADVSYEEKLTLVKEACRDSYAHEFIEYLPRKYDTQVGERAYMLSGGQKQRIAIARSIISRPSVLLLDEATSALDPKAEKIVQRALANISVGRTTIIIAHKLSTVQRAHNIAVMCAGRIIEQGRHHELISRRGAYARLVEAQDLEQATSNKQETHEPEVYEKDSTEMKVSERELAEEVKSTTRVSVHRTSLDSDSGLLAEASSNETMGYSIIRCLWYLIGEQRSLWLIYSFLAVTCILAGGTFPAQAVLFARIFQVFQVRGHKAVSRGNFWALMFFIVAIANFLLYFAMGWIVNIIIQVREPS